MSIIVMITMMMATMVMTLLASLTKVENRGGKVCFSFSNERRGAEGGAAAVGEWQGVALIIIIIAIIVIIVIINIIIIAISNKLSSIAVTGMATTPHFRT